MGFPRFVLALVLGLGVLCGYGSAIGHAVHGAAWHGPYAGATHDTPCAPHR